MPLTAKQIAVTEARNASNCAAARLWGWKYRAELEPPTAARGAFPYPGRSCSEWSDDETLDSSDHMMTMPQYRSNAMRGSDRLRDAILSMAA